MHIENRIKLAVKSQTHTSLTHRRNVRKQINYASGQHQPLPHPFGPPRHERPALPLILINDAMTPRTEQTVP